MDKSMCCHLGTVWGHAVRTKSNFGVVPALCITPPHYFLITAPTKRFTYQLYCLPIDFRTLVSVTPACQS